MTIQSNRSLGGYGASLVALGIISTVITLLQYFSPKSLAVNLALSGLSAIIGLLSFVGLILVLLAMHGFSKDYQEPKIMNHIWTAIIIIIIGFVIVFAIAVVFLLSNLFSIFPNIGSTSPSPSQISDLTTRWLAPFLPIFAFVGLISIIYIMRSLNLLADKSGVALFRVSAKTLLASVLVTIVIGIIFAAISMYIPTPYTAFSVIGIPGGIIQEATWILLATAYFRIKPPPAPTQPIQTVSPAPPIVPRQVRYCTYCGSQNTIQAQYCTHCGQKI